MRFVAGKNFAALIAIFTVVFSFVSPFRTALADGDADPQYVMDWRATGPTGGDVRALVVDPSNPDRFYFGTLDGQIYTSTDGGQNWRILYNFNRPQLFVDNIVVDSRDSNVIYVATHRHKEPGGFYKSTDGGRTFNGSNELKNEALHSLTQSSENPNMLIVGANSGLFRSTDSGDTWQRLSTEATPGLRNVESLAVDPRDSNVIYAGTWYLPYKSTDGGQTWSSIKNGMIDDSDVFAIDINPKDPDHVIASACSGIYDSRNGGQTWRKVQGIPSQSRRTRSILQHPTTPEIVFAGTTEGFWRSTEGGADGSWMLMTTKQLEINSIAVHPRNPNTVLIGTNNYGVMMSKDGGKTFVPSNGGYSGRFANSILSDREVAGRVYATTINTATGGGFFFVSNDGGDTWQPSMRSLPNRIIGYTILQDQNDGNIIYLGTNIGVYRSTDRGASWAPVFIPKIERPARKSVKERAAAKLAPAADPVVLQVQKALMAAGYDPGTPDGRMGPRTAFALRSYQADKALPVTSLVDLTTLRALGVSTSGGSVVEDGLVKLAESINILVPSYDEREGKAGIIAGTNSGLYRSYDPMQGWEKVPLKENFDQRITTVSISPKDPESIWVGTSRSGVLVSRDRGASWTQIDGVPNDIPVYVVKQDPRTPANVYVGTKQTFFMSKDDGRQWTRRGGNLPYGEFTTVVINPKNGNDLFVGNTYGNVGGVYHSTNGGDTWERVDPRDGRLASKRIWALALDNSDAGRLFIGSHSAGIYIADRGNGVSASGK